MADEEKGAKWWIRYVVVPILAGGGIITILSTKMSQPKNLSPVDVHIVLKPSQPPATSPVPAISTSSTVVTPKIEVTPRKSVPMIRRQKPTESPLNLKPTYVTIRHPRDLYESMLFIDGHKPNRDVIVETGPGFTRLQLMPGTYKLSATFESKECSIAFTVPDDELIPFYCDVPFKVPPDEK